MIGSSGSSGARRFGLRLWYALNFELALEEWPPLAESADELGLGSPRSAMISNTEQLRQNEVSARQARNERHRKTAVR